MTKPARNSSIRHKAPKEDLPVRPPIRAYRNGPTTVANLPKISKNPKYSLDSFLGTSFP